MRIRGAKVQKRKERVEDSATNRPKEWEGVEQRERKTARDA
jgi:hypothetical protein